MPDEEKEVKRAAKRISRQLELGILPESLKNAMDIKNIKDVANPENSEKIQAMLKDAIIDDDEVEFNEQFTGRPSVPKELLEKRNQFMVDMRRMGFSLPTIRKLVNGRSNIEGWGTLKNDRSVQKVFSAHYKAQKLAPTYHQEFMEALKETAYEQQEYLIEKGMVQFHKQLEDKNYKWKPFEFIGFLEGLGRMRQQTIENHNWNESKANPSAIINNNMLNVFDESRKKLLSEAKPREISEIIDLIETSIDES